MIDIDKLVHDLGHPGVPLEVAALLGCLALAYATSWLLGRSSSRDSVCFARLMQRLLSWLAWIAAVLWIYVMLPELMDVMSAIRFAFGKSKVSLLSIVRGVLSSGVVLVITLWISAALERRVLRETVTDLS